MADIMTVMAVKDKDTVHEKVARGLDAVSDELNDMHELVNQMQAGLEAARRSTGMTMAELAERVQVSEEAIIAFAQTVGDLLAGKTLEVRAARRAALIAVSGQAWENELGPLLTSGQVRELLGGVSRQRVDELLRSQRLIGLRDSEGRRQFPAFQFIDAQPLEPLIAAFWSVNDGTLSEWTAAAWCVSRDDALDGATPVAWARLGKDTDKLLRVAGQDRAQLIR